MGYYEDFCFTFCETEKHSWIYSWVRMQFTYLEKISLLLCSKLTTVFWPRWSIGRNPLLPCTTKRRITTNLKSINNQKCHKIKLYGTPTTKELKKTIYQNNQTCKVADGGNPRQGSGPRGQGWLNGKLRLRAACGLQRLPQWEKLPVSHEIVGKWG